MTERFSGWKIEISTKDHTDGENKPIGDEEFKNFKTRQGWTIPGMGININNWERGVIEVKVVDPELAKGTVLEVKKTEDKTNREITDRNIIGETLITDKTKPHLITLYPGFSVVGLNHKVKSIFIQQPEHKEPQDEVTISISETYTSGIPIN